MTSTWKIPVLAVFLAIVFTTSMDATGLSNYSAFALLPLLVIFWLWQRLSRREAGFVWGGAKYYGLAVLHPVIVIGAIAGIGFAMRATDLSGASGKKIVINLVSLTVATFLVALITEEGFFRGYLWGALRRTGLSDVQVLVWTSVGFAAWHISAVVLPTGFNPPKEEIPVFLINATVIGAIWGMLRWLSGSVVVTSLCHGLWNGVDYVLFGFGAHKGALGIQQTSIFGPENGYLGLGANLAFAAALWFAVVRRRPHAIG